MMLRGRYMGLRLCHPLYPRIEVLWYSVPALVLTGTYLPPTLAVSDADSRFVFRFQAFQSKVRWKPGFTGRWTRTARTSLPEQIEHQIPEDTQTPKTFISPPLTCSATMGGMMYCTLYHGTLYVTVLRAYYYTKYACCLPCSTQYSGLWALDLGSKEQRDVVSDHGEHETRGQRHATRDSREPWRLSTEY